MRNLTSSIGSVALRDVMASTVERMRRYLAADGGHLKVCNIQKLVQVNKPQDFSFRLVYEKFVISNKLYKHHLFFVRPNLIFTL